MTIDTDDLQALSPRLCDMIQRLAREAINTTGMADPREINARIGLRAGAMRRAGIHFKHYVSARDADIDNGAAPAFTIAWCLGEQEAMRRVMAAISTPAAKGREVEIVAALMRGDGIAEAIASVQQSAAEAVTRDGNVVALRPHSVTERAE